jgi:hypothetical protein
MGGPADVDDADVREVPSTAVNRGRFMHSRCVSAVRRYSLCFGASHQLVWPSRLLVSGVDGTPHEIAHMLGRADRERMLG